MKKCPIDPGMPLRGRDFASEGIGEDGEGGGRGETLRTNPTASQARIARARIDTHLVLDVRDVPTEAIFELQEEFTRSNPEFYKMRNMGYWTGRTPRQIRSWEREGMFLILPRGARKKIEEILEKHGAGMAVKDCTLRLPPPGFSIVPEMTLRPYQAEAVENLLRSGEGVVRGPCGSGKTVILLGAIEVFNQPTIVIVHNKALAKQWRSAVMAWLGIQPGSIEAGKRELKPVTVATQQSLWRLVQRRDEKVAASFGLVVADECVVPGTPILMADGSTKKISEIRVGDNVAVGGKVLGLFEKEYDGEVVRIGDELVLIPDHPVATPNSWVDAGRLTPEDTVIYPRGWRFGRPRITGAFYSGKVHNLKTENEVYVAGGILVHNCHRFAARTFKAVAEYFPAAHRIAASADERRKDGLEHLVYETFGPRVAEIEREDLVEMGNLLPSTMIVVPTNYIDELYLASLEAKEPPDWTGMISRLVKDPERNILIQKIVGRILGGNFPGELPAAEPGPSINARVRARARSAVNGMGRKSVFNNFLLKDLFKSLFNKKLRNNNSTSLTGSGVVDADEKKSALAGGFFPIRVRSTSETKKYEEEKKTKTRRRKKDETKKTKKAKRKKSEEAEPRILLLGDRVSECKNWVVRFELEGVEAGLMIGGPENRGKLGSTISGLRRGKIRVGVGTTVADEGLDIPALTHVLVTCPVHQHPKRLTQMIGRAARPHPGKSRAVCVYLWDWRMFPFVPDEAAAPRRYEKFLRRLASVVDEAWLYLADQ